MKVELSVDGMLTISSETDLESYALAHWCTDNPHLPSKIMICCKYEKEENK